MRPAESRFGIHNLYHGGVSSVVSAEHFPCCLFSIGKNNRHFIGASNDVTSGKNKAVLADDNTTARGSAFRREQRYGGREHFLHNSGNFLFQRFELRDVLRAGCCRQWLNRQYGYGEYCGKSLWQTSLAW